MSYLTHYAFFMLAVMSPVMSPDSSIPPDRFEEIDKVINPIIEMIINNQKEIISLVNIRDAFLPKLMNGEIEV